MKTGTKKEIQKVLRDFFSDKEQVIFVYLFGSIVDKKVFRDIDVAVYMKDIPDIISQGKLQAQLDNLLDKNVDLVLLNRLPTKNPAFAYEIMTKGELLQNKDQSIHTKYKSRVFSYYFDTAYLREQFEDAFKMRMKTQKFGERNYG
ncbi:type VII toxin-antitoxin system MntA family adenylyltransferase antitoxin [Fodinibius halophilus]|uniref:Nucleotidyltransferase domain-containing protein n=1 Tax=Fodinibius halophilus TaxID=1736908 RepID=A0A6M1T2S5_9BACT|nr:nucleotidyltransferase domain-containing protein [Fodinibius halophilus]NGP88337.1 nucleotidyltransferase domain-containing protein [Fodinibius halophilus]